MDPILSVQNKDFSGDGEERRGVYESFFSRRRSRKLLTHTTLWNLVEHVKIYHGIIVHQRLTVLRRTVFAERAVRRIKEGTSAVLLQSGLDEKWLADSMECYFYPRNIQDLLSDGKTPHEKTIWRTI